MKKTLFLALIALAGFSTANAQYMPMEKGVVLTYESTMKADNKTEKYTATVDELSTAEDGTVTVILKENHNLSADNPFASLEQSTKFTYNPADGKTEHYLATAEDFKQLVIASMKEMAQQAGQYVSEQEVAEVEKLIKPKGQLIIPLPAEAAAGQSFPNSTIRCSLLGNSMGIKVVKGSYLGREELETPAGKFDCLVVSYIYSVIGEGTDMKFTTWYAPNIGIVKHINADKKGKELTEDILVSVSVPAN